jgi:AcrR family transcriptional regulator
MEQGTLSSDDLSTAIPGVVRLRDQQATLTRRTILTAARRLFAERGYAATSIRLLAQTAGVSPQTIYTTYGSKAGVLAGLPDLVDEEADVIDLFAQRHHTDDPAILLGLLARIARQIQQRCGDVLRVLRSARDEPDIATVLAEAARRERLGVQAIIERLNASGALAGHLTVDRATDIAVALISPDMGDRLVHHSSWSYSDYETWLTSTLCTALTTR